MNSQPFINLIVKMLDLIAIFFMYLSFVALQKKNAPGWIKPISFLPVLLSKGAWCRFLVGFLFENYLGLDSRLRDERPAPPVCCEYVRNSTHCSLFKRVLTFLKSVAGHLPRGGRWHQELMSTVLLSVWMQRVKKRSSALSVNRRYWSLWVCRRICRDECTRGDRWDTGWRRD